jgi:uncharacterized protein (DUF433 family)/DNA-binding transcriptional MerR regulator
VSDLNTVVFALSVDNVVRLTGLTKGQLQYWDKKGFFPPQYASEDRKSPYSRVYSFRDVVGLRTLSLLRNEHKIPFQRMRKFAESLANYDTALWSRSRVYVFKGEPYIGRPDADFAEDRSGQMAPVIFLRNVIGEIEEGLVELKQRGPDQIGKISKRRFVVRNSATIEGTRIPIASIKRYHEAGFSIEEILNEYPALTKEDIKAALSYDEKKQERVA